MSIRVMSAVWDRGPDDKSELLLLLALADYANDDGACWPSINSLMQKSRLSERGVQSVLKRLAADGWIEIEPGNGRNHTNLYRIINPAAPAPRTKCTPQADAETPHMTAINPAAPAPKPLRTVKEPSENVRKVLCTVLSEKAADDFIAHRKAKRAKLTERAAELIVEDLSGTADPDAAVRKSIKNGWTGVFPDKSPAPAQSTQTVDMEAIWKSVAEGTARQ